MDETSLVHDPAPFVWTHSLSHGVIALSALVLAIAIARLGRRRPDLLSGATAWIAPGLMLALAATELVLALASARTLGRLDGVIHFAVAALAIPTAWQIARMLARVAESPSAAAIEREIEDRAKAERALRRLRRELADRVAQSTEFERNSQVTDEFLATLSHELRTPLNSILGWTDLLLRGTELDDKTIRGLKVIDRNARAQTRIVEDLLDTSAIVAGKIRIDRQPVSFRAAIEAAVQSARPSAEAKKLILSTSIDDDATVLADPARLQQIAWNLLANAAKFTPEGGTITISTRRAGGRIELVVEDSGVGIAPELLPHVFDRFRQGDSSAGRSHGGLGLGLAIVRSLVRMHDGEVGAHSAGPGRGARFEVSMPMIDAPASATSRFGTVVPKLGGVRVLIVDDERDSREVALEVLRDAGATVDAAESATAARERLSVGRYDAIVCDLGMPGETGDTFVRSLGSGRPPAIALTAMARREDRLRAAHAGFEEFLTKPLDARQLVDSVARLASH